MTKPEIIEVKLSEIKLNPNNPRLIKDDKFKKLVNSIKEFPEMLKIRPIVVNSDMVILGGNMRYKACKEAGMKEVSIIIADNLTEDQQREFLIKDNVSGGEWDWEVLSNEWDSEQLEGWGLEIPDFEVDEVLEGEDIDINELFDIEIPFYKPSDVIPEISDLANLNKVKQLIIKIESLDISNDLKDLLKIRASFFADFNFQKIADYYSSNDYVKEVFEDLGMVILAPKEALKKGFIELKENLLDI